MEGWTERKLSEICTIESGKAHEPFIHHYGEFICVTSKFISSEGKSYRRCYENLKPAKANDILMVLSDLPNGRALAKCLIVDQKNDGRFAVNQRIGHLKPTKIHPKFLYYLLNRNKYFLEFDDGVNQTNLSNKSIENCSLTFPSSLIEQQAIAEALSDADALIASLEKLIEKKSNLFKSLFNQLLSEEQNHLNEIGSWQEYSFDRAYHFLPTATNPRSDLEERGKGKSYIHYGDIHTKYGMHLDCSNVEIPSLRADVKVSAAELQVGDLVMADASEDLAGIGMATEITGLQENKAIISGLHTYLLRQKEQIFEPRFQGYFFNSEAVKSKYLKVYTGMKVYGVSKGALKQLSFKVPDSVNQTKVVEVLDPFNQEIECLKQRLTKAKKVKAGMMQELLTGRTRLI